MNIQIFGKPKCFDTKKAERYFKERKVKFQLIDISKYGISKGEYQSVKSAVGDMYALIDEKSKEYDNQYIKHLARADDIEERLLSNPGIFKTPSVVLLRKTALRAPDFFPVHIVRNGKQATVGYKPDVWKAWE